MKFSVAFLVALALSGAVDVRSTPIRNSDELSEIFQEFLALVPQDKVIAIALEYLENDAEVQAVVDYVQSDGFKDLVKKVENIEDVIKFYDYLQESGLDIYSVINGMHEMIGLPPLVPSGSARSARITGGIAGLVADIKAVLPVEDIKALFHEKLETSAAFAQLIDRFRSPRFQELIDTLRANEEFQKILKFAKEHGVDVKAITDLLSSVLGLEFPSKRSRSNPDLHSDLMDFLALVPVDEVGQIFERYVEEDAEVQAVMEYAQSDDFKHLVEKVESIEDVMNFYDYLQESGLDVYDLVNRLHEAIGLPPLAPSGSARSSRITGGIAGLVADVKAVLPLDDIRALFHEKLETSPAFAQLIERLQSPRFQELIDTLRANKEFQKIVKFAKEHGIDVKAITDLLSTVFGLEFPSKHARSHLPKTARGNLNDDLDDFLALLPVEEITEIVLDYMTNDKEIIETMEYLQSDNFHNIVVEVEGMKETKDILAFLEESGINVSEIMNEIHDIIGLPPFHPFARFSNIPFAAGGGLTGLIADIKAILPIEKIKALYYEKLENSPSFQKLIKRLSSPEFQEFVDAILAKEEARVIIDKLKSHGVDIQAVADLVSEILGLHFPKPVVRVSVQVSEQLQKDLADFIELLPAEQLIDIAIDYVFNDREVQKAAAYVKSAEFKEIAIPAMQNREFRSFVGYLDDSGLPVSSNINKVNKLLGLPEVVPSALRRSTRAGGGVRGMLDAMEAILPVDEINALFEEKKQTSDAFKYMVDRLHAQEFVTIVHELSLNEDFRTFGFTAAKYGVSLEKMTSFISKLIGMNGQRSARSLDADLQEFVALVPAKEVRSIVTRYYLFDKEFKAAVKYAKSPAFAQLIRDLHEIPEYNELLTSLEAAGLDVPTYVAKVHELIGFTGFRFSREDRKTGGMAGFIAEIKATLPTADIKALYKHKLETSEDFAGLVELIKSDKFQAVTNALFANKTFQDILHRLQGHGIDLKAVSDFFLTVFGITTPPGVIDFVALL